MPPAYLASRRTQRMDRLIASAVLAALIAGWILNFVSVKEVTLRIDSLVGAATRWA